MYRVEKTVPNESLKMRIYYIFELKISIIVAELDLRNYTQLQFEIMNRNIICNPKDFSVFHFRILLNLQRLKYYGNITVVIKYN